MAEDKKIMIVAGEASGDLHGSNLIKEYRKLDESAHFYGIGSTKMRATGMEVLYDSREIAVVGILEVLSHIRPIMRALSGLKKRLRTDRPDLLILIDFPDFNFMLAKYAKKIGVKVLYYISPQVWAWRRGRVKKIAKLVDKMAVIFPFEVELYEKEGVDVSFVGHPLVDCVKPTISKEEYKEKLGIPEGRRVITVMPGSRENEIKRLLDELLGACEIIQSKEPESWFMVSCADSVDRAVILDAIKRHRIDACLIEGGVYDAINASDFVIAKSGTTTLEVAILAVPMVIVYSTSAFTYFLGTKVFGIDSSRIGLANIVYGENVVPELIQEDLNRGKIAAEVLSILNDKERYVAMKGKLETVKEKLGSSGASEKIARLVKDIL